MHKWAMAWSLVVLMAIGQQVVHAQDEIASTAASPAGIQSLSTFGPVATSADAEATLAIALSRIHKAGGGILTIGPEVSRDWVMAENPAPSSTRRGTASVTIVDYRNGYPTILLPSNAANTGTSNWLAHRISRTVRAPIDMAYGVHSTVGIDTAIAGGTSSYLQRILADVQKGEDQRIYVPTVRGLAVDNVVVLYNPNEQIVIKALGWDAEKQLPYIVADVANDHAATPSIYKFGTGTKHVVNSLTITDNAQSDNQSMTVKAARNVYADGDGFVFSAVIRNQANIMSSLGDEGALCYGADIFNDLQPFRSNVESIDWANGELVYAPGMTRNHALGTGRPLINMNPEKHLSRGTVLIVAPGHRDPWDPNDTARTGHGYEGEIFPGGAIIGSKECAWTQEVVGRFFAVDEPTEYLDPANDPAAGYTGAPDQRVYRWYHIRQLDTRADGSFRLYVERTRWVSSINQVPLLYQRDNYSDTLGSQAKLVPLRYLIAPGAYVADVSRAWTDSRASGGRVGANSPRTLRLAASSDAGKPLDFAPGDPIVQAIGQDPWNPTGMRVRHHNYLPSTIEDSSYQSVNYGRVPVHSALAVHGGGTSLDDAATHRKGGGPAYLRAMDIGATSAIGIRFGADVSEAAIRFDQPNGRPQPLIWQLARPNGRSTLTVDPQSGNFQLKGGAAAELTGVMVGPRGGISAGALPAHNLRGIAVPVPAATTRLDIAFPVPELDTAYSLVVQPTWFTMDRVVEKRLDGFTVEFSAPPSEAANLDWQLLR